MLNTPAAEETNVLHTSTTRTDIGLLTVTAAETSWRADNYEPLDHDVAIARIEAAELEEAVVALVAAGAI